MRASLQPHRINHVNFNSVYILCSQRLGDELLQSSPKVLPIDQPVVIRPRVLPTQDSRRHPRSLVPTLVFAAPRRLHASVPDDESRRARVRFVPRESPPLPPSRHRPRVSYRARQRLDPIRRARARRRLARASTNFIPRALQRPRHDLVPGAPRSREVRELPVRAATPRPSVERRRASRSRGART